MAEKNLNSRIVHKHDIEVNWSKATNFIPKIGEIIVYDPDENHAAARVKIGDGVKTVIELAFIDDEAKAALFKEIDMVDEKVEALGQLVGNVSVPEQIQTAMDELHVVAKTGSWNDLEDKPFGDNGFEFTYSGNYGDYEYISPIDDMYYIKISNDPLSAEELIGAEISTVSAGEETTIVIGQEGFEASQGDGFVTVGDGIISVTSSSIDMAGLTFSRGLYFFHSGNTYISKLVKESIKQLDEKFIPSTIARVEDIPVIEYFTPEDIDIMCAGYVAAEEVLF